MRIRSSPTGLYSFYSVDFSNDEVMVSTLLPSLFTGEGDSSEIVEEDLSSAKLAGRCSGEIIFIGGSRLPVLCGSDF